MDSATAALWLAGIALSVTAGVLMVTTLLDIRFKRPHVECQRVSKATWHFFWSQDTVIGAGVDLGVIAENKGYGATDVAFSLALKEYMPSAFEATSLPLRLPEHSAPRQYSVSFALVGINRLPREGEELEGTLTIQAAGRQQKISLRILFTERW